MYRGYYEVWNDDGKRMGRAELETVAQNLNAHVREADENGWRIAFDAFSVISHLGKPTIRLDVDSAWEVRLATKVAHRFLKLAGWRVNIDLNASTRRAMYG